MPVVPCFSYPADLPPRLRENLGISVLRLPERHSAGCIQPAEDTIFLFPLSAHVFQLPGRRGAALRELRHRAAHSLEVRSMPYPCFRY